MAVALSLTYMRTSVQPRDGMQLRMEADVRRLLRRASNPFLLASCPLAQALCETTGIPNAQAALQYAIDGAFQEGAREARLRQMLLSSLNDGTPASDPTELTRVSKRHFQRRRAKAVSILALHVRRLIGGPHLAAVDDANAAAADPLETIAELVSSFEPAMASQIFRLGGPHSAASANMLALRDRVDVGADLDGVAGELGDISLPLVAILNAQARLISGRHADGAEQLWPLFDRSRQDSTGTLEMRFELEWLAFLRARQRGDARQMDRIARSLRRLAANRAAWLLRALLALAEARIRCGMLHEAVAMLDEADRRGLRNFAVTELACSSALRSEIFLQQGDDAAAERLASGAYVVLRKRHFAAWRCQTTVARARLRLGRAWSCPDDLAELSETAWDRVALSIEHSRHRLAEGDAREARSEAREALAIAAARGYDALAARAAATLAATYERGAKKRESSLQALSLLLATRDRSVACDLFACEEAACDRDLTALLHDKLVNAIPQLRPHSGRETDAAQRFLDRLRAQAVNGSLPPQEFDRAIEALDSQAPSFAQYLRHFLSDATDIVETLFAAVVAPQHRSEMQQRLKTALRSLADSMRPDDNLRRFLVG